MGAVIVLLCRVGGVFRKCLSPDRQLSHSLLAGCSQPPEPSYSSPQCPRGDPKAVAVSRVYSLVRETGEG